MNTLPGIITHIQQSGAILLVDVQVENIQISALLIESTHTPDWLHKNSPVFVVCKETEISIAKNLSGSISTRNRIPCTVTNVERGELLSTIYLSYATYHLQAAITTRSVDALNLQQGDTVEALIKANEVSIMKQ
jgi:molybdate transport system regulatory protein